MKTRTVKLASRRGNAMKMQVPLKGGGTAPVSMPEFGDPMARNETIVEYSDGYELHTRRRNGLALWRTPAGGHVVHYTEKGERIVTLKEAVLIWQELELNDYGPDGRHDYKPRARFFQMLAEALP